MQIVILRFSSIGDILLATPVLDVLKEQYPNSHITWVIKKKFKFVIENNQLVDKVESFENFADLRNIRKLVQKSDLIFDLHNNWRSFYLSIGHNAIYRYTKNTFKRLFLVYFKIKYRLKPITEMYFKSLNKAGINTPSQWNLSFQYNKNEISSEKKNFDYLVIAPGASYFTKMWPALYFAELVNNIINSDLGIKVIILGKGVQDNEAALTIVKKNNFNRQIINLVDKLNFSETAFILESAKCFIGNDSGLMHLAEVYKIPVVAIFGSTVELLGFYPYSTNYMVCENKKLSCRPCTHFGRRKCPKKHFKCMSDISVKNVFDSYKKISCIDS